jgi:hypothetical protein
MSKSKKSYKPPEIKKVSLVPDEAVLEVCKNHLDPTGSTGPYGAGTSCGYPAGTGGHPCVGVTGS